MSKFIQKTETKQFIKVYHLLKKNGIVESQTDFVDRLSKNQKKKYLLSSFNQVLLGNRDVPLNAINLICSVFNANRDYIFEEQEPAIISPEEKAKKEKSEVEFLRDLVKSQQIVIENLSKKSK